MHHSRVSKIFVHVNAFLLMCTMKHRCTEYPQRLQVRCICMSDQGMQTLFFTQHTFKRKVLYSTRQLHYCKRNRFNDAFKARLKAGTSSIALRSPAFKQTGCQTLQTVRASCIDYTACQMVNRPHQGVVIEICPTAALCP